MSNPVQLGKRPCPYVLEGHPSKRICTPWSTLPGELKIDILEYLPIRDLLYASMVSSSMREQALFVQRKVYQKLLSDKEVMSVVRQFDFFIPRVEEECPQFSHELDLIINQIGKYLQLFKGPSSPAIANISSIKTTLLSADAFCSRLRIDLREIFSPSPRKKYVQSRAIR